MFGHRVSLQGEGKEGVGGDLNTGCPNKWRAPDTSLFLQAVLTIKSVGPLRPTCSKRLTLVSSQKTGHNGTGQQNSMHACLHMITDQSINLGQVLGGGICWPQVVEPRLQRSHCNGTTSRLNRWNNYHFLWISFVTFFLLPSSCLDRWDNHHFHGPST